MAVTRGSRGAQQLFALLVYYVTRDITKQLRVTSSTGGVHDPDSQHPLGTALDFGVRTPVERAAALKLLQRWRALGLTGLDEGDHVHVQLFRAGQNTL